MDEFRTRNFIPGNRVMHNTICSDCRKDTKVPFVPAEGRPVYCRECLQNHKK